MRPVLTGILLLALFAADFWLLFTRDGQAYDQLGYNAIHNTYRAPWLDRTMRFASKLGEPKSAAFGVIAFGFFGTPAAQLTAKLASIVLVSSSAMVFGIKWLVNRERPDYTTERNNSSLPSGHAAGSAAVAVLVTRRHGRIGILAWAIAIWISLSRVYLGRHFPTDVLSGILLGTIAAWLVLRGERWFAKLHF